MSEVSCKPIDSIAVSGHKCWDPTGITLSRKGARQNVEQHIAYLNSVTTIMGSRNGQGPCISGTVCAKGHRVLNAMLSTAWKRLTCAASWPSGFDVPFERLEFHRRVERPMDATFAQRWRWWVRKDIAHVWSVPNVTRSKIDTLVGRVDGMHRFHGRVQP
jgi:hypothetical protein